MAILALVGLAWIMGGIFGKIEEIQEGSGSKTRAEL